MADAVSKSQGSPAHWNRVLERIEQALEQAEGAVARQSGALGKAADAGNETQAWTAGHTVDARLEECSRRVPAALARAEQAVAGLESRVKAGCTGLDAWLAAMRALDEKLARWTAPPV